jgi:two-component system chemotaxis response regulator CheB
LTFLKPAAPARGYELSMTGRIFAIGASLSGIDALCELVARLPAGFPAPIFVTQHVAPHSPGLLPHLLREAGPLPAEHPKTGTPFEPGRIYVAPPDRHMLVEKGYIRLSHGPHENLARPAIDPLFRSAAVNYGPAAVGIVLTGQLNDGTAGLLAIKDRGGYTIVQDPGEATARAMPYSAIRHVAVDKVCRLGEMAPLLVELAEDAPPPASPDQQTLMEVENRIAEGVFTVQDWWVLEGMSTPSGLNCPNCSSALYELRDQRVLRYRCRSGHAFTAESLLSGQADAREAHLSSLFGALIEEATLAKRLTGTPIFAEDAYTLESLTGRIDSLDRQANLVSEWLHQMMGLVEPEPRETAASSEGAATGRG